MKKYTTKQRNMVLSIFADNATSSFDAKEVYHLLQSTGINKSTVYRNLDKLVQDRSVVKELSADGTRSVYRFNETGECNGHLHLICSKCKQVIHLEEKDSKTLDAFLGNRYGFSVSDKQTVIKGTCTRCSK